MRILLIEDEKPLSEKIKTGLKNEGLAIDQSFDDVEGKYLAETEEYDLIILDLMLPKIDGLKICAYLRQKKIKTPILILTAKETIEDKVLGLNSGADDYLTKPFSFLELRARVFALLRRNQKENSPLIKIADLEINQTSRTVKKGGEFISLTPKEFAILEFLARHGDEVVTRTQISDHVWDYNFDSLSNVVDVFIATLRKKVGKNLIKTVHGVGYKLHEISSN